jgi:hypothetical protein
MQPHTLHNARAFRNARSTRFGEIGTSKFAGPGADVADPGADVADPGADGAGPGEVAATAAPGGLSHCFGGPSQPVELLLPVQLQDAAASEAAAQDRKLRKYSTCSVTPHQTT